MVSEHQWKQLYIMKYFRLLVYLENDQRDKLVVWKRIKPFVFCTFYPLESVTRAKNNAVAMASCKETSLRSRSEGRAVRFCYA